MPDQYKPDELPKSVSIVVHTHYCYNSEYSWQMGTIRHDDSDISGDTYVCLAKTPVHIEIQTPDDLKKMVLDALEAEKKKQMAEYHKKMFELQEKIDALLCLEYKPAIEPEINSINDLPF